ncbi:MAG TPA: PGF-pre-PGF domain-containing protein [Methanosarcina sp.]|jgi:PGF-pre-PGF domain-containing protein
MDKRCLVFIVLLILLSSSGIGITAAESSGSNSTNTNSVSTGLTDDNSVNDTSTDNTSANNASTDNTFVDNTSVNDVYTDNNSAYNTSIDNTSIDNTSVNDAYADNNSVNNVSTANNLTNESELISSEPQTNIQHTEISQVYINNEQNVNINITNYNSVVNNINFDSKKSLGKTTIVVEDLKDKSYLINNPPAGNIYKSFNIWINNGDVNNNYIENAVVNFQVEKSWLKKNNFDESAIVLNIYSKGKWIEIPVTITGQNTKYVYFKAKVSGYSSFAITGNTDQATVTTKPIQQVNNNSVSQNEIIRLLNEIINRLDEIIKLLK